MPRKEAPPASQRLVRTSTGLSLPGLCVLSLRELISFGGSCQVRTPTQGAFCALDREARTVPRGRTQAELGVLVINLHVLCWGRVPPLTLSEAPGVCCPSSHRLPPAPSPHIPPTRSTALSSSLDGGGHLSPALTASILASSNLLPL